MKKSLKVMIASIVMCGLLLGAGLTVSAAKQVTLHIMQYGPEFAPAMEEMAAEYNKDFPNVKIEFEISQATYNSLLKAKLNAGDLPDVFMLGTIADVKLYKPYLLDITNEPFVKNFLPNAMDMVTLDGKVYGFPIWFQSYGLIYNKKVFREAGITDLPETLSQLEEVCKKLEAKDIIPFSNGYGEWWVFKHIFTHAMAAEEGDPVEIAQKLNKGELTFSDLKEAGKVFDFIDLTLKYGQPDPVATDFSTQCSLVGTDKAAILQQGDWAELTIMGINPDAEIGFLGQPIDDNPDHTRLMAASSTAWVVSKDNKNVEEVLKWMDWMTTSDYGKNFISLKVKATSTIKGASQPDSQLVKEASKFLEKNQTYFWVQNYWPHGFDEQLGVLMQAYVIKEIDKEQCLEEMTKTWVKLAKAQAEAE